MDSLFISYRREDSAPYAGRIYDALRNSFPNLQVFMDIDGIQPGDDFVTAIDSTLAESQIVLAVVGPKWLALTDQSGLRRLDSPDDYVVRELHAAFEMNAFVIPVLVGGANMPTETALPVPLKSLARRNAIEISDTRFRTDMERLGEAISRVIDKAAQAVQHESTSVLVPTHFKRLLLIMLAVQAVSLLIGAFRDPGGLAGALGAVAVAAVINAWPIWMLLKGRGWARILFILLQPLNVVVQFAGGSWALVPNVLYMLLCAGLIWMMFTDPTKRVFVKHEDRVRRR